MYLIKRLLFVFTFFVCYSSQAQDFIGLTKQRAGKKLERMTGRMKYNALITETDSTLTYSIRDTAVSHYDKALYFDGSGKCYKEVTNTFCGQCYRESTEIPVSKSIFRWAPIDSITFIARPPYRCFLTLNEKSFSWQVDKSDIEKSQYRNLFEEARRAKKAQSKQKKAIGS